MIEDIEELRPELKPVPFGKRYALEYGKIEIIDSGRAEYGIHASLGTISPLWRICEAIDVKPLRHRAPARLFVASCHNIRAYVSDTKASILERRGRASPSDLEREAPLECGDAINSPTTDHLIGQWRQIRG